MSFSFLAAIEALLLALSLSTDAFVAGFAYGSNKIKIPILSVHIINTICCLILGVSLLVGALIRSFLPPSFTLFTCFIILFILGITKLLDSITKSLIRKYTHIHKEVRFSMFNFKFILKLYANPEEADIDASRTISSLEATSLAIALSLDGLAVGFGAALGNVNVLLVILFSLLSNAIAIVLGCFFGNQVANKISFDLSWISGLFLIILAFFKLL